MLGEVAGAKEADEESAARRGSRREERDGLGLGDTGVKKHGVGAAGSRVFGGDGFCWGLGRLPRLGSARHSFEEMPRWG